jgi:predicted acetyltransferase
MTQNNLEIVTPRADQLDALDALLGPALHFAPGTMGDWLETIGLANIRAVRHKDRFVAGLGFAPIGQWFGGARVPMAAITAVGVAPDWRGAGVGSALLRHALKDLRIAGIPLAALYPSSLRFYRRAGFERAGQRLTYELPLEAIDVDDRSLDLVPFDAAQYDQVYQVYEEHALRAPGNLDRPSWMWQRRLEPKDKQTFRFLVTDEACIEGYVVFTQAGRLDPLTIADVCVLTPGAGRRILGLLAGYRSMIEHVTWHGGPLDPLVYLLGEQMTGGARNKVKIIRSLDWVLRIVDVAGALAARGYPPGLSAELHLDVYDEVLPANAGRWVLAVSDGRGAVRPGGAGRIRLHVRDLAAIYSGFMAPHECAYLGTIAGSEGDLGLAGTLFSGPRPWIADMF